MNEILERLYCIGLAKNALPPHLRGWVQELGLSVRVVEGGRRILAGGRWRPSVQAHRGSDNEEWQVIKFDQAAWDRRFANFLEPTYEIADYLLTHAADPVAETEFINALKNAIRDFKKTGNWSRLPILSEHTRNLTQQEKIRRLELHLTHEKGSEQFSRLAKRLNGGRDTVLETIKEMDSLCGQMQILSCKLGRYKAMQADAIRTSRLKRTFPGLEPLRWINCYDSGLIYLAALAYEVRGIGIVVWDEAPSEITGKNLGHDDTRLLSELATHEFLNARGYLERLPGSTNNAAVLKEVGLALEAALTMTDEAFERFDAYMQTKLGYRSQPTVQHSSTFEQKTDYQLDGLVGSGVVGENLALLDEIKTAYVSDTQSVELQRQLFEAGRYRDMEEEVKRNLLSLMDNPVLPDSLQLPKLKPR